MRGLDTESLIGWGWKQWYIYLLSINIMYQVPVSVKCQVWSSPGDLNQ